MNEALEEFHEGAWHGAEIKLVTLISGESAGPEARRLLALMYGTYGAYGRVIELLQPSLADGEWTPDIAFTFGRAALAHSRVELAQSVLEGVLSRWPDDDRGFALASEIAWSRNEHIDSAAVLMNGLRGSSPSPELFHQAALILSRIGLQIPDVQIVVPVTAHQSKALDTFRRVHSCITRNAFALASELLETQGGRVSPLERFYRAKIAFALEEFDSAERLIAQVDAMTKWFVLASMLKARVCIKKGKYAVAIEVLRGVLIENPTSSTSSLMLAFCLARSGRKREARNVLEETIQLHPINRRIAVNMIAAYVVNGNLVKALRSWSDLSRIERRLGTLQTSAAVMDLKEALTRVEGASR